MLATIALGLLLADTTGQKTQPRQREDATATRGEFAGTPTDPLFDRKMVSTDDPTFVRNAVEASRQGAFDAHAAAAELGAPIGEVAERIAQQYGVERDKLESLARRKGWPVPAEVPQRTSSVKRAAPVRMNADFIVSQIAAHQGTLQRYRVQIAGTKDPELARVLREVLAGYEKNLELLLQLEP